MVRFDPVISEGRFIMRKLQSYVDRYGPEVGSRLYRMLQSQAGHASVGARLRRKLETIRERSARPLPLFPEVEAATGELRSS